MTPQMCLIAIYAASFHCSSASSKLRPAERLAQLQELVAKRKLKTR